MKTLYIDPEIIVYDLPSMQLLAGSGPEADDQIDPSLAPLLDNELEW